MHEADPDLLQEGVKMFFSSRGCPYHCSYCFNKKYNEIYNGKGKIVRYRSPENFVDEIVMIKKNYPLNFVGIADDTFILKPLDWLRRFKELYTEKVNLPFNCNVRANLVTEEIISVLKNTGLDSVWMGVECGDEKISNKILGRNLKNSQIINAVSILKNFGIKVATQNLVGLPTQNAYKVDLATLDFNIKLKPMYAWSSVLYPYPGTPVSGYAKENGFLEGDVPFLETNKRFSVFNFSKEEKRKIENLHKLFGIIVEFPFLRRYCDFLCKLPFAPFYTGLFYICYGYNLKFRLYPLTSLKDELGKYFRLWLKIIKKN